jgi:hypothetical protein
MSNFLHIVFWLLVAVWFFRKFHAKSYFIWICLSVVLKIVATFAFVYLHKQLYSHYTPDYTLIFADACRLSDLIHKDFFSYTKILLSSPADTENWHLASQPRAFFAVKLYSPLVWLTGKKFWLSMIYASFLALVALWWLVGTLAKLFPKYKKASVVSFIFLPSVLFWASATSKEVLLMIFLAVLSGLFLNFLYRGLVWWQVIIFLVIAYWLASLKYYYAFGFLLLVCLQLFLIFFKQLNFWLKIISALGVLTIAFGLTFLHPNLQLHHFAEALYDNYTLILQASAEGSAMDLGLEPTWQSLLLHAPLGLWVGLFAPLPYQASKWQMLPITLESSFVLALWIYVIFLMFRDKSLIKNFSEDTKSKILLLCVGLFVLVMATFLGLSSPNFGALSRYRIGFLPFEICFLLILLQEIKNKSTTSKSSA